MRVLVLLAMLLCAPALAEEPADALEAAQTRLAEAETALAAARKAENRTAALGLAVEVYEAALADLRSAVVAAGVREREIALDLALRRTRTSGLLAALQGIARAPDGTARLHPEGALAAARTTAMLAHLRPRLEAEAQLLSEKLEARAAAQQVQQAGFAALTEGLASIAAARGELAGEVVATSQDAGPEPDAALAAAARESDTLEALAAALGGRARTAQADGALAWPVRGSVLRGFEAPDGAGVRHPVLVLDAPPQAVVRAPGSGRVRYAGPFLDYGQVVALRLDGGATVLLAGLSEVAARAGARVAAGAPLGVLGGRTPVPEEYVTLTEGGAEGGAGQTLHILMVGERGPMDPAPWFGAENG